MYRAPVAEISHTLKHVAGLDQAIASGKLGDLSEDLVDADITIDQVVDRSYVDIIGA